ncbi:hypothetical protein SASPL_132899 [Salvia splendens]|uniref:Uncharacterized protein n=1 Tax=Salvia splendens TaxID=180675 RepID=A0A8X8ZHK3_SALSN|nr:hypothetical protein SASPL_132899 [Salvia splendens]
MPSAEPPRVPQNHLLDGKENMAPYRCLSPQLNEQAAASAKKSAFIPVTAAPKLSKTAAKLPVEPLNQLGGSNENVIMIQQLMSGQEVPIPDDVIVLDSEDSDDENIPVRSKLSITRRL